VALAVYTTVIRLAKYSAIDEKVLSFETGFPDLALADPRMTY
jgi:hypothetical protein